MRVSIVAAGVNDTLGGVGERLTGCLAARRLPGDRERLRVVFERDLELDRDRDRLLRDLERLDDEYDL